MLPIRIRAIVLFITAPALALALTGCAGEQVQKVVPQQPTYRPNAPVPPAEIAKARRVIERHLAAYSKGDLETVLETVPLNDAVVYRTNIEQMAKHSGFKIKSITARRSTDPRVRMAWSDLVNLRVGYTSVVVFRVEGEYPNSTPDDNLLEEFDAIMARTPGGRWLYVAGSP